MLSTLKRIWHLVRPYPGLVTLIMTLGLIMAACQGLLPKLVEVLFRDVLERKDTEAAKWVPYTFPLLFLINGTSRYFHLTRVRYLTELVVASLREKLLSKVTQLNLTFHNQFGAGSGGLMSRFLNDTALLQEGIFFGFTIVREPITAIALLGYMLYLDWRLTLYALLFLPIISMVIRKVSKSLRKYGYMNREAMEGLTGTIKESLDGMRVIQSFNLESEMNDRFAKNQREYLETRRLIINREEGVSPLNEFIVSLIFMGFAIYAIHEVFGGRSSPGQLIAFITAAAGLQIPVKNIQNAQIRIQQTIVIFDRLHQLLDSTSTVPQVRQPKPFPKSWQKIKFENVSFAYGDELVLRNVNLEIKRGEVIALVGESGSGKSTIVNMLERFFDPTKGRILIDDTPLNDFDLKDLRRNIALVTQDVFLFRDTIERNIQAGDFTRDISGVLPAAKLANAHSFIEKTPAGYMSPVGDRGNFLSGGEKQRVSIARAIFKDAPILILDEATSALDSVSEMEVQKGLNQLMQGRTAFVIAHRLSTVMKADRILVLKKGQVVEEGSHNQLLEAQGEYYSFFRIQSHI